MALITKQVRKRRCNGRCTFLVAAMDLDVGDLLGDRPDLPLLLDHWPIVDRGDHAAGRSQLSVHEGALLGNFRRTVERSKAKFDLAFGHLVGGPFD